MRTPTTRYGLHLLKNMEESTGTDPPMCPTLSQLDVAVTQRMGHAVAYILSDLKDVDFECAGTIEG